MRAQDITIGQKVKISRERREGTVVRILPAHDWAPGRVVVQFDHFQETFHAAEIKPYSY